MIDLSLVIDAQYEISDFKGKDLTKLSELELFQFCKANRKYREPGIHPDELRCMHEAVSPFNGKSCTIVETGMCFGVSTRYFAIRNLKYGGKHINYELFLRESFKEDMVDIGLWDSITKKGHSIKDSYEGGDIDILLIDSEHAMSDALGEYMRFRPWLKGEAIIGFHDTDCCPGVRRAIEVILTMDDLILISESTNIMGAGMQWYRNNGVGQAQHRLNLVSRQ